MHASCSCQSLIRLILILNYKSHFAKCPFFSQVLISHTNVQQSSILGVLFLHLLLFLSSTDICVCVCVCVRCGGGLIGFCRMVLVASAPLIGKRVLKCQENQLFFLPRLDSQCSAPRPLIAKRRQSSSVFILFLSMSPVMVA